MTLPRVAVIGAGTVAVRRHLPAFRAAAQAGRCTLVGVCDRDLARARAVAAPDDLPAFDALDALLAHTAPDLVSIATQPASHRDLTVQAHAAGCHVLCEKPPAMTRAEAVEMVAAATRAGRLLSLCLQYRYWDEAVYLRERIAAGVLGHVYALRTWGGDVRGFPASQVPRTAASARGGALAHCTVHNLDLALWLLGYPAALTASAWTYQRLRHQPPGAILSAGAPVQPSAVDPAMEDFGAALVRLAGGTVLTIEANYLQPPSARSDGWELLGDRGAASLAPLRVWADTGTMWVERTPAAGTLAPPAYGFERLVGDVLARVQAGGPAPVSGPEIVSLQGVIDALYASRERGHEVVVGGQECPEAARAEGWAC